MRFFFSRLCMRTLCIKKEEGHETLATTKKQKTYSPSNSNLSINLALHQSSPWLQMCSTRTVALSNVLLLCCNHRLHTVSAKMESKALQRALDTLFLAFSHQSNNRSPNVGVPTHNLEPYFPAIRTSDEEMINRLVFARTESARPLVLKPMPLKTF
jgi:hypothetical protein